MKTPTIKSIQKKYRNAKEVRCLATKEVVEIDKKEPIVFEMNAYWTQNKKDGLSVCLYNIPNVLGYAEIISYIEPTTKVRNSVLLQLADNNSYSEEILKKECPKLFENKIEVGKWYKCLDMGNLIYYKSDNQDNYGLSYYKKEWSNDLIMQKAYKFKLATPQEVETALIQEAKKRGYKKDIEVVDIYNGKTEKDTTIISSNNFDYEIIKAGSIQGDMALRDSDGNIIFHNGTWATIIETPTDIITIFEKYGKDKVQEYLNNAK